MRYRLCENLFCCKLGQRVVLLDLKADRYFRLTPVREAILRRVLDGEFVGADELQELRAARILGSAAGPPAPLPSPPAPREIVLPPHLRTRKRDIARSLAARVVARRRLRRNGLLPLVEEIGSGPAQVAEVPHRAEARLAALAAGFAASRALLRSQDRCLPDSLAMMALCRREALRATLIFGVRLDPFIAHCWVQSGDVVITGEVDDARMCSPILVLP